MTQVQILPAASTAVDRAFHDLNTRVGILGRAAKGSIINDPSKALVEARAVEASLKALKLACREQIANQKAAAKTHAAAEKTRIAYEASIVAAREAAAVARAEEAAQPTRSTDAAVEGLVAMAKAASEDRAITVNVGHAQPNVLARLFPSRRKVAA